MGLDVCFNDESDRPSVEMIEAPERLLLTKDGSELVRVGDRRGVRLYAPHKGFLVPKDEFERLGSKLFLKPTVEVELPKRKPGRPKGSKSKK